MKKAVIVLYAVALTGVFAVSCQKEISSGPSRHPITFRASLPEQDGETKAIFGTPVASVFPVLWESTDVAAVTVDYAAKPVSAAITPSNQDKTGTFTAKLDAPATGSFTVQAVVPEWALVSYNTTAQDITLNIPASQTPLATGPDPKAIQLVASRELDAVPAADEPVELQFHHATAYSCISLTKLPTDAKIHAIDLIFSVPVSGKWKYKATDGSMTADVPANIITLHTSSASKVFFGCSPAKLEGQTLKVRLTTEDGIWEKTVTVKDARQFKAGTVAGFSINMGDASKKTSIKLLSIGNSFSQDAQQYLWDIIHSSGEFDEIVLGNLYIGGCSLETHVNNHVNGISGYTYYKNTAGKIGSQSSKNLMYGLTDEDWDYITLQQYSGDSGIASSHYPYLERLIDIVRGTRPQAKLLWHMTWAYQQNSKNSAFPRYNKDQMTMYNAILSVTQKDVVPTGAFGDLIPAGTVVQNLRTSPLGDTITRDGYHMSYKIGRYAVGLEWYRVLSGKKADGISYKPGSYTYSADELSYIKDAVEKAYWVPFAITPYVAPDPDPEPEPDPGDGNTSAENFTWVD